MYFESGDSFFDCFLVFYKHITATFHSNDSRRFAQETYRSWKVLLIFFSVFYKTERNWKNELREARKILDNVSFGSFFNSRRPSPNDKLFTRQAKFSELSS